MSNCPHRRPGGIVNSSVDENEPCPECEAEKAESRAFRAALLDVIKTIGMGALAVAIVWALMGAIVFVSGWMFGVGQ